MTAAGTHGLHCAACGREDDSIVLHPGDGLCTNCAADEDHRRALPPNAGSVGGRAVISLASRIDHLYPCAEAVDWLQTGDGGGPYRTDQAAWDACPRADWMLWLASRCYGRQGAPSHRQLVRAACACARTALPRWEAICPADRRPHVALDTAEAWARGGRGAPSLADVRHTALAVAAAYTAVVRMTGGGALPAGTSSLRAHGDADARGLGSPETHPAALAAYAAYDAVVAAYAAYTPTAASVAVSEAARALAYAAGAPSSHVAAARELVLAGMADLVRGIIPRCPRLRGGAA